MPMELHPIAWLHIPLDQETGAADSFANWNAEVVLRVLATIIQRLGGRKRGEEPTGLRFPYVCDTPRMYCDRTSPRAHPARILNTTTCWSKQDILDLAVHQIIQRVKAKTPLVAKDSNKKTLPVSTEIPSNPRAALEIFLNLHSRLKEGGHSVGEEYARGIQIFKNLFVQYGHPELANSLPDFPQGSTTDQNITTSATAPGSSQQPSPGILPSDKIETRMEEDEEDLSIAIDPHDEPMTDYNFTLSGGATPAQDEPETGISQMDAADIESELNNLLTIDDSVQYPPLVVDPSSNPEPAAISSIPDPQSNQNDE